MKLLLISLNFAPELTSTGKYTGEFAAWLAERGHQLTVIAGLPHYPAWRVDDAYRGAGWRRERYPNMEVLRVPHSVPPPGRVTAVRRILMESTFTLGSLRWWLPLLMRRERFDAVIAVCPPLQNAVLPGFYRLLRRAPWILHIQDFQVDAAVRLGMLRIGILGRALYWLENFCLAARIVISCAPSSDHSALRAGCTSRAARCEHAMPVLGLPRYPSLSPLP